MRKKLLTLAGTFTVAVFATVVGGVLIKVSATVPGTNTIISLNTAGTAVANSGGGDSQISADGTYVAFASSSTNLVSSDTNSKNDVFVRNLTSNSTALVSISTNGTQANADSFLQSISETGRYIIFRSNATNLIDGTTTNGTYQQLYLRDTLTGNTSLLSKNSAGDTADNNVIGEGVSADGRFVLFESTATNLGPTITNTASNLFLLDRSNSSFTILNDKYDGTLPDGTSSPSAAMSCDGSFVVFQGSNSGYTQDTSNHVDVYLVDLRTGKTKKNLTYTSDRAALYPSISCNGDYIGFSSTATNLDPVVNASQGYWHAFVYNRINDTFSVVDQQSGTSGNASACYIVSFACAQKSVAISDNGIAVFESTASNLSTISTSGKKSIYIRNMKAGVTELLSKNSSGVAGDKDSSYLPTIDARGSIVTYGSLATNLSSMSANNKYNTFTSLTGY